MCHWAAPLLYLYVLYLSYLQFWWCTLQPNLLIIWISYFLKWLLWCYWLFDTAVTGTVSHIWIFWFHSSAINIQNHSFNITGSRNQMVVFILFCPPQGAGCDKTKTWHILLLSHRVYSLLRVRYPISIRVGEQKDHHSQLYWTVLCVVCDTFPHISKPSSGRLKYVSKPYIHHISEFKWLWYQYDSVDKGGLYVVCVVPYGG